MKIGDIYYEKHTVVGISKRTNTVSETDVEIVNVLPIDVLDKIRAEIEALEDKMLNVPNDWRTSEVFENVLDIIDKYRESEE